MSDMRQNKLTGQWVILAPDRGDRPRQFQQPDAHTKESAHVADCPFCLGNEHLLPDIIMQESAANGDWQTRVVPNKYPVLTPDQAQQRQQRGIYVGMPGYGHHEVIIEHPRHNLDLAHMSDSQMALVIETYHKRYTDLMRDNQTMMVILFRNHGRRAGTSIKHPHSQLIVTGIVPRHIRWREEIAQHYYDTWGRALLGDILEHEVQLGTRVVGMNDSFVTLVPYAAEVPFETWIVPQRPQADFGSISDAQKQDLTSALRDLLRCLYDSFGDPDYNFVLHTAARYKADEPHLHWYIQVRPRLVTRAGFEIGSGVPVNPSLPEDDAQALREAIT